MIAGTTDGNGKKTDQESIDKDLAIIKSGLSKQECRRTIEYCRLESTVKPFDLFMDWIK